MGHREKSVDQLMYALNRCTHTCSNDCPFFGEFDCKDQLSDAIEPLLRITEMYRKSLPAREAKIHELEIERDRYRKRAEEAEKKNSLLYQHTYEKLNELYHKTKGERDMYETLVMSLQREMGENFQRYLNLKEDVEYAIEVLRAAFKPKKAKANADS